MGMSILYDFEHKLIPSWVFGNTNFLNDVSKLGVGKVLFNSLNNICKNQGLEMPYKEEEFGGITGQVSETIYIFILVFPAPKNQTECYCTLVFYDKSDDRTAYYTFEKGIDLDGSELQFFCEWTQDGTHKNYGSVKADPNSNIGDLFLLRFFYMKFKGLPDMRIPYEPKEATMDTKTYNCGICKTDIYYDTRGLKEDEDILIICPKCGQIYQIKN